MANIFHRLKAYLYKNTLTPDPNDYIIRALSERTLNIRQICESASTRGGAGIPVAAMEHAVNLWLQEMAYQLCDGFTINTGWFTGTVHIKGVCNSPNERYDPKKHTLVFEFHQGSLLRKEIPGIEVEFLGVADSGGHIAQVIDVKSGSVNDLLTPGYNLRITGDKLKIAGDHASIGISFRNPATDKLTQIAPSDIVVNNPSELIIRLPELDKGTYQLEIVTQFGVGFLL
ncbi:MAG: DUF4469 domain-containing protein, partial [Tannerella sp.]|nr:DUF4469 domain-containing protein [Tannerella sp.]